MPDLSQSDMQDIVRHYTLISTNMFIIRKFAAEVPIRAELWTTNDQREYIAEITYVLGGCLYNARDKLTLESVVDIASPGKVTEWFYHCIKTVQNAIVRA
jgi:lipoprotein signal peptidase